MTRHGSTDDGVTHHGSTDDGVTDGGSTRGDGAADTAYAHAATLTLPCTDEPAARRLAAAVAVEAGAIDDDRSRASVSRADATVTVELRARDHTALRAGLNTWARLLDVASQVGAARDNSVS